MITDGVLRAGGERLTQLVPRGRLLAGTRLPSMRKRARLTKRCGSRARPEREARGIADR
jgi:hypothetical protein